MKDNAAQAKDCEQLIERLIHGQMSGLTSALVLTEVVWTSLSYYQLSKIEVVQILQAVTSLKYLTIEQNFDILLATEYYEHHAIKFVDACLAAHDCFNNQAVVMISYDKDFDKLPVKRLEPKQII